MIGDRVRQSEVVALLATALVVLFLMKSKRISDFGKYEQTDLGEL